MERTDLVQGKSTDENYQPGKDFTITSAYRVASQTMCHE